ncbi:purple acid phosphatase family protein [Streptomyces sp. BE230]|uniref:purple acid phosphatase family protein n=1 Tax=Streptomyces sp. BE230 TaxID=3002526 RepID=UPI002ED1A75A|nr:metallophosphoesterase family protein [Streptomyces sp. BE230]
MTLGAAHACALPQAALLQASDRRQGSSIIPFGRHLAFGSDPATSMSIAWQTPALVDAPYVRIGDSPTNFGERIPAETRIISTLAAVTAPVDFRGLAASKAIVQYYLHAALRDLEPDTTYYYVVGHRGLSPEKGRESIRVFTTAPADPPEGFTFTAFGDQGVSREAEAITHQVRELNPAFHLHAGDISYADPKGSGRITNRFDPRVWDAYFQQIEDVAASVPWQFVVGNHDVEPWYGSNGYDGHFARLDFPTSKKTWYSFSYGNVAVVSLDGNDISHEYVGNTGYSGGEQTAWLTERLASYRSSKDVDFIVVQFHYCAYCSSTEHGSDGGVRADWVPLFDRYGVDLVINGHNHLYERTDGLVGGQVRKRLPIGGTVECAADGTVYVTVGTAGQSLSAFTAADSYDGCAHELAEVTSYCSQYAGDEVTWITETVDWSRVRYAGVCLLKVDVSPRHGAGRRAMRVSAVNESGAEIDSFTILRAVAR